MALIVQMKSATIHLHNKRPSRQVAKSRSRQVQFEDEDEVADQISKSEAQVELAVANVVVAPQIILIHVVGD